jgi:hypothetical protein
MEQLLENNLLEGALGFGLGLELGAKLVEDGAVFIRDDGVVGGESVGAGVLSGLALAFFGTRSGTELGVGGDSELAGWRHGEGPFLWNEFWGDFSWRAGGLEVARELSCGGAGGFWWAGVVNGGVAEFLFDDAVDTCRLFAQGTEFAERFEPQLVFARLNAQLFRQRVGY